MCSIRELKIAKVSKIYETSAFDLLQLPIIIFSRAKSGGVLFMEINPEIGQQMCDAVNS